ncbi:MAG: hypothetical protein PHD54_03935 [Desulfuromonadaceae bacterium]|nr:hypothetical protein [Desulfuromonadaceae bacterium]
MSTFSFANNRRGIALLNVIFIFILIGALAVAGAKMYGSKVSRAKINETKGSLENEVMMITAWAVKNSRLPTKDEYPGVFGGTTLPVDAWGRSIFYIYSADLTVAGSLCGRTSTSLAVNLVGNNAFALVSGGEDHNMLSTANSSVISASNAATSLATHQSDLYRVMTLDELKNKASCYGASTGRLRLVNNELPKACTGIAYNATIVGDGGTKPYLWQPFTNLPAGLIQTGAIISGTPTTAGVKAVSITVNDSQAPTANSAQRTYNLNVIAACAGTCPSYTVNNTTSRGHDYAISGVCQPKKSLSFPLQLGPGQTISLYTSNSGKCVGNLLGTFSYSDLLAAGGNSNCTVDFGSGGGGGGGGGDDDHHEYDEHGYDHDGRDHDGYDHNGRDRAGYDHDGYDSDGRDGDGRDHDGYDRDGKDKDGHHK